MGGLYPPLLIMKIPVSTPSSVAPSSGIFSCGRILATDGFECSVYSVYEKCHIPTKRPYVFLSAVCSCGNILALSGNCSNRVYVLTESLTEIDGFTPKINAGPLLAVYPCPQRSYLLLTYRNGCYISDCEGNILNELKRSTTDKDFISCYPLCNGCLHAYNDGCRDVIEYHSCCYSGKCFLPDCVRLKNFTTCDDGVVYGFFTKGYPYSFLAPVLENGSLVCDNIALC